MAAITAINVFFQFKTIIVYTFSTFPHLKQLQQIFPEVIVLKSLKTDLNKLFTSIDNIKTTYILGVALSETEFSYFEPLTVNKFNKNSKVIKNQIPTLKLHLPDLDESPFLISRNATSTFCNYSMYRIQHYLDSKNLNIHFSFVHICQKDISMLSTLNFT